MRISSQLRWFPTAIRSIRAEHVAHEITGGRLEPRAWGTLKPW
jgi:hypothetical protein